MWTRSTPQNILLLLFLQTCVICKTQREETRLVYGAKGGNVILQLNRDDVEDVSWVYDGDYRITTKPGEPIKVRDPDHKRNMLATEDASLVIMNLSQEDEKVYSASLLLKITQETYKINFDLRVCNNLSAADIQIEHNVTNDKPCGLRITCVVKEPSVNVTWTKGGTLLATGNVLYIEDAHSSPSVTCAAHNPVSNVTKTVKPSEFCAGNGSHGERNTAMGGLRLLSLLLVGASLV